jgi:primosomal protein N' (replication factor Y)
MSRRDAIDSKGGSVGVRPARRPMTADLFAPPQVAAERCAEIAVPVPIDKAFTYLVPDDLPHDVMPGARVLVPFAGRRLMGLVLDVRARGDSDGAKLKAILGVVDPAPVLPAELLSFLREVARYYLAPIGEVMALALPAVERKAIRRMRAEGMQPATSKVAPEHVTRVVRRTATAPLVMPKKLSPQARGILDRLEREGETPLRALTEEWPSASTIVRRLVTQQLVEIEERTVEANPFAEEQARDAPPTLNAEQQVAADALVASVNAVADDETKPPLPFLLHGVTGSGKTEVYLRAIAATLARGRGALVLVPEIALTPQLVARFRARFGDEVAVVHSALDPGSRHAMWRKLHEGRLRVAIGARSALFAPVPRLGLVVVDEEHDASFKQEEGVRYHARDCAILRAHRASAVCVVGSATPSLEVLELCRRGKMTRLRMKARATPNPLPSIEILDLRHLGPGPTGSKLISLPLHRALEATLSAREQAILFLNRRGFAPAVICEACGELQRCPDCDVAFTMHRKSGLRPLRGGEIVSVAPGMRCHYCDRVEPLPPACPKCHRGPLSLEGIGTEQLEETLAKAFPAARVARLDRDVASGTKVEDILRRVRAREVDILVGTQMVTKGHDLPFVTLVGVVNADSALSMPDFRAAERTFQLLVQVAGRAGRGDARGTVYIQTRTPDHWAIACAAHHDVEGFVERELLDREELGYPPFSRLVLVRIDAPDEPRAVEAAQHLANVALDQPETKGDRAVEVRGPTPAPVPRVRGRFRWRILLRGDRKPVRAVAIAVKRAAEGMHKNDVRILVDVDPLSMM